MSVPMDNNTPDDPLLNHYDDEIDLRELFAVICYHNLRITLFTGLAIF